MDLLFVFYNLQTLVLVIRLLGSYVQCGYILLLAAMYRFFAGMQSKIFSETHALTGVALCVLTRALRILLSLCGLCAKRVDCLLWRASHP